MFDDESHLDDLEKDRQADCKECIHFCIQAEQQNVYSLNCMQLMQMNCVVSGSVPTLSLPSATTV